MRASLVLLALVSAALLLSLAAPVDASCVDCYGNFCGDRTRCCGYDGQPQSEATADTPACDGLDELCKAHDLCVSELGDDDTTGGICTCDAIFKSGVEKAKAAVAADPASFDYQPGLCAIGPNGVNEGCQNECSITPNLFTLDTAVDFVGLKESCACTSGPRAGTVVSDVATDCPVEDKCIKHVCDHNNEAHYMKLGWFWRRLAYRRNWWWSWLWTKARPAPPPECDGSLVPVQPPATTCTSTFISHCVKNVPDACNCNMRDLRCLLQKYIFRGRCKTHVTNLVQCDTTDTRVTFFRNLLASADFDSLDMSGSTHTESTTERIKMVYWLPVTVFLFISLLTALTYMRVRSNQYKKRIEMLNAQVSGGRSTGLSVVQGEEMTNINMAADSQEEIAAQ